MSEAKWRRYLRFYRPDPIADLDDELRDHLESTAEALIERGLSPADARAESLRRFGDLAHVRLEVERLDHLHLRRSRATEIMETFLQDLRYGARTLLRNPAFAIVSVLSIALAVAANATVFSVVNATLLRPIPGIASDRLVRVYIDHHSPFSWRELDWFRERAKSFEHIVTERNGAMSFRASAADANERIRTSLVSRGFFPGLGVPLALGRGFDVDERSAEATQPVAVLSHRFWQRRFGGDSSVIGRVVSVSGHPVTVVGVAAPAFRSSVLGWMPEMFLPFASAPLLTGTRIEDFGGGMYTTARLARGIAESAGEAQLVLLMQELARTDPARYERTTVRLDHIRGVNAELRAPAAAASVFLMGMVGLVLLMACANVANLLLGRAASRGTEIGVRLALGAGKHRIVRQLLTESFLLAVLGTLGGMAATFVITRALVGGIPPEAGIDAAFFAPDGRVLLFTVVSCLVATLLFGLVPALRSASPQLVPMLKGDTATGVRGRHRRKGGLLATQASLCVLLLAVASLFWRSLASLGDLDPGFRSAGVVDVPIDMSLLNADAAMRQLTFARILERAKTLPGVQSVSLAAQIPLTGSSMETPAAPDGGAASSRFDMPPVHFNIVTPDYFTTLGMPIRRGRAFEVGDGAGSTRVAIVNETAARAWWPDGDAVGKRIRWGAPDGPLLEVVGVARDAKYVSPGESPRVFAFIPLAQSERGDMTMHLRTTGGITAVRDQVWSMLRAEMPTLPPPTVTTLESDMSITLLPIRAGAALLGALGFVALMLAAAGIYGVTAYAVARRTREIGIRAALGAGQARLLGMVIRESLRPVSTGLVVGLVLALAAAFGLSRVLYGVRPIDPLVLSGVTLTLVIVALAAAFGPAWRASSADPSIAMRAE